MRQNDDEIVRPGVENTLKIALEICICRCNC